jgi:hypothetical protein
MKKYIFFTGLFVYFFSVLPAQEKLEKNKELSVVAGMASTKIKNTNLSHDENIVIDNKNGANFSFEFSKYFANRIGIGFGLGYSGYDQAYSQKGLYQLPSQVDRDGDFYDKWVSSDIVYSNKLSYFNVPVTLHLLLGHSSRFYGFIDAGIVNQFLINGTYTANGSIETMARYSTNNPYFFVVTQNNSYYNVKFSPVATKDAERYKFYNLSGHLAVGIAAAMTDRLSLKVQPFADFGFSDIMGPNDKGKDYENVLGQTSAYKPTTLFAAGINVGFAFNM